MNIYSDRSSADDVWWTFYTRANWSFRAKYIKHELWCFFSVIWTSLRKSLNNVSINYDYVKETSLPLLTKAVLIKLGSEIKSNDMCTTVTWYCLTSREYMIFINSHAIAIDKHTFHINIVSSLTWNFGILSYKTHCAWFLRWIYTAIDPQQMTCDEHFILYIYVPYGM
jgi:hypothetical protein